MVGLGGSAGRTSKMVRSWCRVLVAAAALTLMTEGRWKSGPSGMGIRMVVGDGGCGEGGFAGSTWGAGGVVVRSETTSGGGDGEGVLAVRAGEGG